jgi:hypothetical protein
MASRGAYGKGYSRGFDAGQATNSQNGAIVAGIIGAIVAGIVGFIFGNKKGK